MTTTDWRYRLADRDLALFLVDRYFNAAACAPAIRLAMSESIPIILLHITGDGVPLPTVIRGYQGKIAVLAIPAVDDDFVATVSKMIEATLKQFDRRKEPDPARLL